jgi:hypothetical protein
MPTQTVSPPTHSHSRARTAWHFVRHYLEMVVAMLVGMIVLGQVESLVWPSVTVGAEVGVMIMASNMAVGMAVWMRVRGHSWRGIAEMSASMYIPFAVLLVPFWAGAIEAGTMMTWGHVLMLPAMALAMALRPAEYAH